MTTTPCFFGPADARLFGFFHAPTRAGGRNGVLLCNAVGHEYMAAHRTVRQTAIRLARAGTPAMRFDFHGEGDSAGDSTDGRPSRWVADIGVALDELRKRQASTDVSLVGFRLGAALALMHLQATTGVDARALVLWDPIVIGKVYVEELMALQRERFGGDDREVLGFPLSSRLRSELEAIDLSAPKRPRVKDILVIETGAARDETRALAERLRGLGSTVEHRSFAERPRWHEPNKSAVPAAIVQQAVAWMAARCQPQH